MDSFLLYLGIALVVILPLMFLYRRHTVAKADAEMRQLRLLQDTVVTGVKTMRGADHNSKRQQMPASKPASKPTPRRVEPTIDSTPDDLMLLSAMHLNTTPGPTHTSNYDDDTRKIAGGGGTFDGGGSSGDWERSAPSSSCSSSSGSSSYDSGSSYSSSSDSSSSSSDSSSSSSDSGSCSSD